MTTGSLIVSSDDHIINLGGGSVGRDISWPTPVHTNWGESCLRFTTVKKREICTEKWKKWNQRSRKWMQEVSKLITNNYGKRKKRKLLILKIENEWWCEWFQRVLKQRKAAVGWHVTLCINDVTNQWKAAAKNQKMFVDRMNNRRVTVRQRAWVVWPSPQTSPALKG